jgi:polysaccharide export outer membrane protein
LQPWSSQPELTKRLQDMTYNAYTLGVGDKLLIRVDGRRPVSREVTVDPQGTITYPRLGRIQVAGLTLPELDRSLGSSLARLSSKPRKVTTTITEYRHQHVYMLGEVRVPGAHPLPPSASILELITRAGGPTPEAGWLALVIKKNDHSQDHVAHAEHAANGQAHGAGGQTKQALSTAIRIDLDELLIGATAQSLQLESGDTIFIPEAAYFFIYGEVERPGRYRLERGMTAIQAISNAGGYTPYAAKKQLKVFRYHVHNEKCGGDLCLWGFARHVPKEPPKEYRFHLHDRLQPADVLVVPAHFGS